uniref:Uncharacterized protein n=1 Tax=Caenorhabditis japonica TaxID=281687 RepID=A0A8R1I857_CAEJA
MVKRAPLNSTFYILGIKTENSLQSNKEFRMHLENEQFQLSMQIIGSSAIEQQNSRADQFGPDENFPISNEETVGIVHSQ